MTKLTVAVPAAAVWDVLRDPARMPPFGAPVEVGPESAVITLSRTTITVRVIPAGTCSVIEATGFVSPVLAWRVRRWLRDLADVAADASWFADVEPDDLAG